MMQTQSVRSCYFRCFGRVQGVGFRYFAQREAQRLGLHGGAHNEWDGSVSVWVQGPAEAIEKFADRLRVGPRTAWVERVSVTWDAPATDLARYEVRF